MTRAVSFDCYPPPRCFADPTDDRHLTRRSWVRSQVNRVRVSGDGPVRMSEAPQKFGLDGAYSAFPGATRTGDGRILIAWRQGTDHVNSRDGAIRTSFSLDEGRTFSPPVVAVPYPGGGLDMRDAALATSRDGARVWLSYFKGTSSNAGAGNFLRTSTDQGVTWSAEQRTDGGAPTAALTGPLVETAAGVLLQPWYGRLGSETRDSSFVSRSTDGGATWTQIRVANGPSAARDYNEPCLVDCAGTLVMLFRWNTTESIGISRSTDGGLTWSAPAIAFLSGSGRPAVVYLSTGVLVCVYRRLADGASIYRASRDLGATWLAPQLSQLAAGGAWMTYAAAVEVAPGLAFCATGIETSNGAVSALWTGYIADGGGVSPTGDNFPDAVDRTLGGNDQVWVVDNFDRADTTTGLGAALTGQPWNYASGTATQQMRIEQGTARAASADGTVEVAWIEAGWADVLIEADLIYGTESGLAVVMRYVDASNYLLFTIETNGANIRLYKIVAGTATLLVTYTAAPANAGMWHRMSVQAKGPTIYCFVNGALAVTYVLSTTTDSGGSGFTERTRFSTPTKHGLRLNETSTSGPHRSRRFVVRSC